MDRIVFNLENKEFIIELTKRLKPFSITPYSKYECCINFKNSIGQNVLSIKTNEKEVLHCIESLNNFCMNLGGILEDNIYFESSDNNNISYFWYIAMLPPHENPLDEDDERMCISVYSRSMQGNMLRLYIEMSYIALEDFIYQFYLLLEDIPYLNDMAYSSLIEFMGEQGVTFP